MKNSETLLTKAISFHQTGRITEAIELYQMLIESDPFNPQLNFLLGTAYIESEMFQAGISCLNRVLQYDAFDAQTHFNKGFALKKLNRFKEAIECFNTTIRIEPYHFDAYNNRANTLYALAKFDESIADYDTAIMLKPDRAEFFSNRGLALQSLKHLNEALASYNRAITLQPDFDEAYSNRGTVLMDLKRMDEALSDYKHAFQLNPNIPFLLANIFHTQMHFCDWKDFAIDYVQIKDKVNNFEAASPPLIFQSLIDSVELQKTCTQTYVTCKFPYVNNSLESLPHKTNQKIKIGYFSSDFGNHPVTHLLAGLFEEHDRDNFEIIAFSLIDRELDEWRTRVISSVDQFIEVHNKSDSEIAELSRSLEIDIAVDLNGHTKDAKTGIFSHRAAPIQTSYIGFLGTMGAPYYDYLIADPILIPEENQTFYTEKIVYLPSYQCNDNKFEVSNKVFTRSEFGLLDDDFVFCSFNHNYKITPPVFDSWMRILSQVANSVLWIYVDNEMAKINLQKEAGARGINPHRLIFANKLPLKEHLARQRLADLFLDTYPYNAGATASNALRVGLPLVTRTGDSFASRYGASLLNALGLPELVTHSSEEFESLAVKLATQPNNLATVKDKLSSNLLTYPLFDTCRFARNLESAFVEMHKRSRNNLPPAHIYIGSSNAST